MTNIFGVHGQDAGDRFPKFFIGKLDFFFYVITASRLFERFPCCSHQDKAKENANPLKPLQKFEPGKDED